MTRITDLGRRKLRASAISALEGMRRWTPEPGSVRWLFVATFPNGGSTALGQLLKTAGAGIQIEFRGEGQWLVPDLCAPGKRWDPEAPVDYGKVRKIWLREVRKCGSFPCLVIEKSPPNLVRMRALMDTFSDMPVTMIRFTRDPYAVCSSWASRYKPDEMAVEWSEPSAAMAPDGPEFYRLLGDLYGRRAAMLQRLESRAAATITYEQLTDDIDGTLAILRNAEPLLADVTPDVKLEVKDYKPQPLRNMNERQIGALSPVQRDAITQGLAPHVEAVAALGYALR